MENTESNCRSYRIWFSERESLYNIPNRTSELNMLEQHLALIILMIIDSQILTNLYYGASSVTSQNTLLELKYLKYSRV